MGQQEAFAQFLTEVENNVLNHPIITNNFYTKWFSQGDLSREHVKHFTVQFSVFSNLFLIAQLKKMINAVDLKSMRASKEILASEIGVIFNPTANAQQTQDGTVISEGSIEGGKFRFSAAHFEWLLKFGEKLGLDFSDMGKRSHGTPSTLLFTDTLEELFGSEDYSISAGASFAIENWAARGFWKELIAGLKTFKKKSLPELPLGFFVWHDMVEAQHAEHTQDELKEAFFHDKIELDQEKFIRSGQQVLDALLSFWQGLSIAAGQFSELIEENTIAS